LCIVHCINLIQFEEIKTKAFWLNAFLRLAKFAVPVVRGFKYLRCTRDMKISAVAKSAIKLTQRLYTRGTFNYSTFIFCGIRNIIVL
jgi:hypothetical protein